MDTKKICRYFRGAPGALVSVVALLACGGCYTNPVTGRQSLFIGRHAYGIPGLEPEESEKLHDGLVTFACQAPRTYSYAWQPGDVVVWDNRCVVHRARPFDHSEPRVMKHTRVAGEAASELAVRSDRIAP